VRLWADDRPSMRAGAVPSSLANGTPASAAPLDTVLTMAWAMASAASAPMTVTLASPAHRPVASANTASPSPVVCEGFDCAREPIKGHQLDTVDLGLRQPRVRSLLSSIARRHRSCRPSRRSPRVPSPTGAVACRRGCLVAAISRESDRRTAAEEVIDRALTESGDIDHLENFTTEARRSIDTQELQQEDRRSGAS